MPILPRSAAPLKPDVTAFFDAPTNSIDYVVKDPCSNARALVDSVMDIDYAAGRITFVSADKIIAHIKAHDLALEWRVEAHVHADRLSAARPGTYVVQVFVYDLQGGNTGLDTTTFVVPSKNSSVMNDRVKRSAVFTLVRRSRAVGDQACCRH